MENILLNALVQLGAVGILVAVLMWLVIRYEKRMEKIHNEHAKERTNWQLQNKAQHEEIAGIAKTGNKVMTDIQVLIAGMKL